MSQHGYHSASRASSALAFSPTDYSHTITALRKQLHETHEHLKQMEILAARLVDMERHNPHMGELLHSNNHDLQQAIAAAKLAFESL